MTPNPYLLGLRGRTPIGQKLVRRYGVALLLLLSLSTSSLVYLRHHLDRSAVDGELINLSGRQRMLSQRIALYAIIAAHARTPAEREAALAVLTQDQADFSAVHSALHPQHTAADPLDDLVQQYLAAIDTFRTAPGSREDALEIQQRSADLLGPLHAFVLEREHEATRKILYLQRLELLLWGLTVGALVLEAGLVFWPSIALVERSLLRSEQLRRKAEAAEAAQRKFLSTMSHEIRTPLNAILGSIQLAEERPMGAAELQDMQQAAQHLLVLLNNLLDASKLSAGELPLSPARVELTAFLGGIVSISRPLASLRGLALSLQTELGPHDTVELDEGRVRQILLNLIGNALKFTEEGEVVLGARPAEGGTLLWVQDTGPGIPLSLQDRIFQPFFQVEGVGTQPGTGLGLAISRDLAVLMGGRLTFSSVPAEGTTFSLWLPSPPAASPVPPPIPAAAVPRDRALLRVLIAEDNLVNQRVLQATLEGIQCVVTTAGDGVLALAAIQRARFDLLITDNHMPQMGGAELIHAVRALGPGYTAAELPILALTADDTASTREVLLLAGASAHMVKPFALPALRAKIRQLCRVPSSHDEHPGCPAGVTHTAEVSLLCAAVLHDVSSTRRPPWPACIATCQFRQESTATAVSVAVSGARDD